MKELVWDTNTFTRGTVMDGIAMLETGWTGSSAVWISCTNSIESPNRTGEQLAESHYAFCLPFPHSYRSRPASCKYPFGNAKGIPTEIGPVTIGMREQ